jgi:hypothetical protein
MPDEFGKTLADLHSRDADTRERAGDALAKLKDPRAILPVVKAGISSDGRMQKGS